MKKKVTFQGREYIVEVLKDGNISVDGEIFTTTITQGIQKVYKVLVDEHTFTIEVTDKDIFVDGEESSLSVKPHIEIQSKLLKKQQEEKRKIIAPIPGKIIQILVRQGEKVSRNQELIILEAMKMRNRIFSPIDGKITQIHVKKEDNVSQDQTLIEIER
ncbi:MAG: biotin/lipoyl-binding protein [Asgard group archaeon]|nr:biotin/lipoyl-binding protein [Asgard group archaeon]